MVRMIRKAYGIVAVGLILYGDLRSFSIYSNGDLRIINVSVFS